MFFNYPLQQTNVKPSLFSNIVSFGDTYKKYIMLGIVGLALMLPGNFLAALIVTILGGFALFIHEVLTDIPNLEFTSLNDEFDLQDMIDDLERGYA